MDVATNPSEHTNTDEDETTPLDPKWITPVVHGSGQISWWAELNQGVSETAALLGQIQEGEQAPAQLLYTRVIRFVLTPQGRIGNGYHDFEGPLAALVRVGVLEILDRRDPHPREVSPSCIGPGTSRTLRGSPITWTVGLTDIGASVRNYWFRRSPWTGMPEGTRPPATKSVSGRS